MKRIMVIVMVMVMVMLCGCNTTTTINDCSEEPETEAEFQFYVLREDGTKDYGKPIMQSPKVEYATDGGCVQKSEDGVVVGTWAIPKLREDARIFELIGNMHGNDTLVIQNGKDVWFLVANKGEKPELVTSSGHVVTYSVYDERVTAYLEEGEDGKLYLSTLGLSSFHESVVEVMDKEGILEPSILDSFVEDDVFVKDGEHYRLRISAHRPRADSPWGELEYSFAAIKEEP